MDNEHKPQTFCELMRAQLIDEQHAGELYETAIKLLQYDSSTAFIVDRNLPPQNIKPELLRTHPVQSDYAILEKVASDERSHKILLQVLTERLCP